MRKVHLISITDPLMLDLAMAIRDKGYEVSVSGNRLSSEQMCLLEARGIICYGNGWFPEKLTKDTYSIVLGCQVSLDNQQLHRGKELGLRISSVPEFIYQCTKSKTRVVIAGSHGRRAILSLMVAALSRQKMAFDYATTSRVVQLAKTLQFSFESRIALIEGDEHITSVLDKRSQLEFYRPHIAVMTNMVWDSSHDHATPEAYMKTYRYFSTSIEREGKLIYYGGDPVIGELVEDIRADITAIPFDKHPITEHDGQICLQTRYGDYPVYVPDDDFLVNVNAARLACRQLGVKDTDFYQAIADFTLSLKQ